jgi:hypothetical protein
VSSTNCLATTHPEIAAEWHPVHNLPGAEHPDNGWDHKPALAYEGPHAVLWCSNQSVWWQCPSGHDHVYMASLKARTKDGHVCPYCSNKRVSETNSLAAVFPEVADQWHDTLNGDLTPDDVTFTSPQKVWWQTASANSPTGRIEWSTSVTKRTRHVRFMGLQRQRAMDNPVLRAQQAEAVSNTREKRRAARRSRRLILVAARDQRGDLYAAHEELQTGIEVEQKGSEMPQERCLDAVLDLDTELESTGETGEHWRDGRVHPTTPECSPTECSPTGETGETPVSDLSPQRALESTGGGGSALDAELERQLRAIERSLP